MAQSKGFRGSGRIGKPIRSRFESYTIRAKLRDGTEKIFAGLTRDWVWAHEAILSQSANVESYTVEGILPPKGPKANPVKPSREELEEAGQIPIPVEILPTGG